MFTGRSTVGCLCHITVWSVCAVMLGGVFLEVFFLSICYNRTDAFLVAGIYLIKYDREFVILLVYLLVRQQISITL